MEEDILNYLPTVMFRGTSLSMQLGFPIGIPLRGIARNCSRIARNSAELRGNCAIADPVIVRKIHFRWKPYFQLTNLRLYLGLRGPLQVDTVLSFGENQILGKLLSRLTLYC